MAFRFLSKILPLKIGTRVGAHLEPPLTVASQDAAHMPERRLKLVSHRRARPGLITDRDRQNQVPPLCIYESVPTHGHSSVTAES